MGVAQIYSAQIHCPRSDPIGSDGTGALLALRLSPLTPCLLAPWMLQTLALP